jgi:hypothetical protein
MANRATMGAMLKPNGAPAPLISIIGFGTIPGCSNRGTEGGQAWPIFAHLGDQMTPYCVEGFCWDGSSGDPHCELGECHFGGGCQDGLTCENDICVPV